LASFELGTFRPAGAEKVLYQSSGIDHVDGGTFLNPVRGDTFIDMSIPVIIDMSIPVLINPVGVIGSAIRKIPRNISTGCG
jgi:hypothetical protein